MQTGVTNQLVQYFQISDMCLEKLSGVLEESNGGWVDAICTKNDTDNANEAQSEEEDPNKLNIKVKTDFVPLSSESKISESPLTKHKARRISDPVKNDPMAEIRGQLKSLEDEIMRKQEPIKKKVQEQIKDIRQTIVVLGEQSRLLQLAEAGQEERKQKIKDGKTIKNNLEENGQKIAKHIKESKLSDAEKAEKLKELSVHTKAEIKDVEKQTKKLKHASDSAQKQIITPEQKRIQEQSRLLKKEVQKLDKSLKKLMLSPADKKAIYDICEHTVSELQKAADCGEISKKPLKIVIKVVKCVLSIGITFLDGGITLPFVTSSIAELVSTGAEILQTIKGE